MHGTFAVPLCRGHESNWLPAPTGAFILWLRVYLPDASVIAGSYVISGPNWSGQVPGGMTRIASPSNSVLVIGRVLIASKGDRSTAYNLTKQIQLVALGSRPRREHVAMDPLAHQPLSLTFDAVLHRGWSRVSASAASCE